MDDSGWSQGQNADGNEDSKSQAQEVSAGNRDVISSWTTSHICYILATIFAYKLILSVIKIKGLD